MNNNKKKTKLTSEEAANEPCSSAECMALLNSWKSSIAKSGEYKRKPTSFHGVITAKDGKFKAERNRYHLYASYACPWASRCLAFLHLKGLTSVIQVTIVHPNLGDKGWFFATEPDDRFPESKPDPLHDSFTHLRQLYEETDPTYAGNVTIPVLYDKLTKQIVCNESSEIIRMLTTTFNEFSDNDDARQLDMYPVNLRDEIDKVNAWIYPNINNGVYRAGFAQSQEAYERAFHDLFLHLDKAEGILSRQRYIASADRMTEADIRLFVTLIRFDAVYYGHFKCNWKRISDYPNLFNYTKELYQNPRINKSVNMKHIKFHYLYSHSQINPFRIVTVGPDLSAYEEPHDRDKFE